MPSVQKIGTQVDNQRRYERYSLRQRARAVVEGNEHQVVTTDISAGGAGLLTETQIDNNLFVSLHIDNVGTVPGHVVRTYEGGAAIEFDVDDDERERIAATIRTLNRTLKDGV